MGSVTEADADEWRREAWAALRRGDLAGVEDSCRRMLDERPQLAEAWFLRGTAALQAGQPIVAGRHLEEAVVLEPERSDYRAQFALCFSAIWRHPDAARHAQRALELDPVDPATLNTIGRVFLLADQPGRALEPLEQAVAAAPDVARFRFDLASVCRILGQLERAEEACAAALSADPGFFQAQSMLAELQGESVTPERARSLEQEFERLGEEAAEARLHVGFALSRACEASGDFARAVDVLEAAKRPMRERLGYDFSEDAALFEAITTCFERASPREQAVGEQSEEPIFVMGMPRTGTTLVDRILASHAEVGSAGEVHNFGILLQRAHGDPGTGLIRPDLIRRAMDTDFTQLGRDYLSSIRPEARQAKRFIDKLPHNFLFAGFIALALPRSPMICMRRNPMDTCLGNFRQIFAIDFPYYRYSYDLLDIGRYYMAFDRLLRFWQSMMPGRILEVEYERLVAEPERETRRLLDFCGLSWDPACLTFERNAAPVTSASAVQVRESMHQRAVGRWRRYQPRLAGLRALLEAAGVDVDRPRA